MDNYGVCLQSMIPVRSAPAESAEMTTQLLFGEHYTILEQEGKWTHLRSGVDQYEGWIDRKLVVPLSPEDFNALSAAQPVTQQIISLLKNSLNNTQIPIPAGSRLPLMNENGDISLAGHQYHYKHELKTISATGQNAVTYASHFLNAPYLWGGKTLLGIDCSGLSQVVYRILGIELPRDASQQVTAGEAVNFIDDGQPGDLAFFDNEEGDIIHVGLLMSPKAIIHASGWVRIDPIDHQGIYNPEKEKYSHKLRVIKRIIQ